MSRPAISRSRHVAATPGLDGAAADAVRGIDEAVRILDLMGRGAAARDLAIHSNNLRAELRKAAEAAE